MVVCDRCGGGLGVVVVAEIRALEEELERGTGVLLALLLLL